MDGLVGDAQKPGKELREEWEEWSDTEEHTSKNDNKMNPDDAVENAHYASSFVVFG